MIQILKLIDLIHNIYFNMMITFVRDLTVVDIQW